MPEHDTYHCELGEAFGDEGKRFAVGHRTSIASEPGQRPFDHPSATHDLEAARVIRAFYDFQLDRLPRERCFELLSSIAPSAKILASHGNRWRVLRIRLAAQSRDVGRDHCDAKKQPDRIDDDVALDALGFLSCVVSVKACITG